MCVCGGVGDEEGGPGQWPYIHPQGPVPIHLPSGASAFTFTLRGQCPYIHPQGPVLIHPPSVQYPYRPGASGHTPVDWPTWAQDRDVWKGAVSHRAVATFEPIGVALGAVASVAMALQ